MSNILSWWFSPNHLSAPFPGNFRLQKKRYCNAPRNCWWGVG